jgi:hypothetical protein
MLRSIVFELNICKCGLEEIRKVLNIDAKAKSPFNYTVHFKSGKTEYGFAYIDTSDNHCRLDWYGKTDCGLDHASVDLSHAQWTGNVDGSLFLDGKYINWPTREKKNNDRIEKIIFIPAKEGYLSSDYDY